MYAPHFGLQREPFAIAPDPHFLYLSEQHREALAHLVYGLGAGGGFVLLTGAIGAGKTTVCRAFLEQVPPHCSVAYVFNPKLSAAELLHTICAEFGVPVAPAEERIKPLVDALNAWLLAQHAQGRQSVLVIDEAQSLAPEVLEQLRLLTNLETAERKLLQIVLIGQPELDGLLAQPLLAPLAQRIVARYHLGPLTAAQTPGYIRHRLAVAGRQGDWPFEPAAVKRLHALAEGVPRRINLLADRALLGAYAQGRSRVDRATVEQAAREVWGRPAPARGRRAGAWTAVAVGVLAAVALALPSVRERWHSAVPVPPDASARGPLVSGRTLDSAASSATATEASSASAVAAPAAAAAASASSAAAAAVSASSAAAAASGGGAGTATVANASVATAVPAWSTTPPVPWPSAQAWRALALHWRVAVAEGEPCAALAQAGLACLSLSGGGLALLRQLDRPVLLRWRDAAAAPRWLLASALLPDAARAEGLAVEGQGGAAALTWASLAASWSGEVQTLWRPPPGWSADPAARNTARWHGWLDERLAIWGQEATVPRTQRLRTFQLQQGLPADGVAGPLTMMALERPPPADKR